MRARLYHNLLLEQFLHLSAAAAWHCAAFFELQYLAARGLYRRAVLCVYAYC